MKKPYIKTILVPIDFSKLSGPAIETAKDLAGRFGASVHLVHVHEFDYPAGFMTPVPLPIMTYRDDTAIRRTRRLKMLAKRNDLSPEHCHFLTGSPTFNEVCNLAREISADLIVMPTHSYTGLAHFFGGSTAERIVQHSPCPVLVARQAAGRSRRISETKSYDTILVPVDFSQASFRALEYAIEFAERVAARLILFHAVACGDALTADGYAMYDLSAVEETLRKNAEEQMRKFVGLAKFRRVAFETVVRVAPAVSEICAVAEEREADLIITATHGRSGFRHLLMGSVAESVVRHAKRPVLVVPSHPEIRTERLTTIAAQARRKPRLSRNGGELLPTLGDRLTKRSRKLLAHPAPERRKTNRYRESHSALKTT